MAAVVYPEMITLREAAERTGLSYDRLRKMCLHGDIVFLRAGNRFLVNFGKLAEYLDSVKGGADNGQNL